MGWTSALTVACNLWKALICETAELADGVY